jgi:hypothetical protein
MNHRATTCWSQGFNAAGVTSDIAMFAGNIKYRKSIYDTTGESSSFVYPTVSYILFNSLSYFLLFPISSHLLFRPIFYFILIPVYFLFPTRPYYCIFFFFKRSECSVLNCDKETSHYTTWIYLFLLFTFELIPNYFILF